MNLTFRNALLLILASSLLAAVVAYVQYNKPHKDYGQAAVEAHWNADELVQWYGAHDASEHAMWQDKMVAVAGTVTSLTATGALLSPGVAVSWDSGAMPDVQVGSAVIVQGRLLGFDDLLGEVRLDHVRLRP